MKALLLTTILLTSGVTFAEEIQPREVNAIASEAFVPSGFDSQSESYVVVSGIFPNGCYRFKRIDVDHINSRVHELRVIAIIKSGVCPRMLIPFSEEAKLGKLESGKHSVKIVNGDGTFFEKPLIVE